MSNLRLRATGLQSASCIFILTPFCACLRQVQYPGAEGVMMSDLRNLKALAWFLQKFELSFDILSSLRELSRQIKDEFDFR